MSGYTRTPTPRIDEIWGRTATVDRWHTLWIAHLHAQARINPRFPGKSEIPMYIVAADRFRQDPGPWLSRIDLVEQETRHDLQAALVVFNEAAAASYAHTGLTSHDIIECGTQRAIGLSLAHLATRARQVIGMIADVATQHARLTCVARTHGQPAQATTYGHRWGTILSPLLDWHDRLVRWQVDQPGRPTAGAVGTRADLRRTLEGWGNEQQPDGIYRQYDRSIQAGLTVGATRQVRHRSYDLHTAALLTELATIAQTWATDRRHEAMLGLGNEVRTDGQIGSSAMPHKTNPVLSERICSLATSARGYLTTAAEAACAEWLEGDVSGSATRRHWLPGIFRCVDQILTNWATAIERWEPDPEAMADEVRRNGPQMWTAAAMHWLVEQRGMSRLEAHKLVGAAVAQTAVNNAAGALTLARAMDRLHDVGARDAWNSWDLYLQPVIKDVDSVVAQARRMIEKWTSSDD